MNRYFSALPFLGFAATITLQSGVAFALSSSEIASQTQTFTVQINGIQTGTGTTIEKNGNTYKVLTCWHVVDEPGEYEIVTVDGKTHQATQIYNLPGVDLAIVEFDSTNSYQTAELGNSEIAIPGESAYTAGYPVPFPGFPERSYTFLDVSIISRQSKGERGYQVIYNNPSPPGSSGGGLFDKDGRLIGVNGRVISEGNTSNTYGAGIPLQVYLASRDDLVLNIGQNKLRAKDYKGALEEMDRAINSNPDLIDAYIERAKVFSQVGSYSEAIKDLNHVLKNDSDNAVAYSYRGLNYSYLEEYEKAFADHSKAIELNPNLDLAYANRGLSYLGQTAIFSSKEEEKKTANKPENIKKAIADLTESLYLNSESTRNSSRSRELDRIDKLARELEKSLQNISQTEIEKELRQLPLEITSSSLAKEKQVEKSTILGDNFSSLGYFQLSDSTLQEALSLASNLESSDESTFNILMSLGKNQAGLSQEKQKKILPISTIIGIVEEKKWRNAETQQNPFQQASAYYKKASEVSISEIDFLKAEISYLNLLSDNKIYWQETTGYVRNNLKVLDVEDQDFIQEIADGIEELEFNLIKEIEQEINVSTQAVYSRITDLPLTDDSTNLLIDFSEVLVRSGKNDADTIKVLETAIAKANKLNDVEGEALSLYNLALLYEQRQELNKAIEVTEKGLNLVDKKQHTKINSYLHRILGRLSIAQGKTAVGITEYEESLEKIAAFPDLFEIADLESITREYVNVLLSYNPSSSQLQKAREAMEFLKIVNANDSFIRTVDDSETSVPIDEIDPSAAVIYPIILEDRLEVIVTLPGKPLLHYTVAHITKGEIDNTVRKLRLRSLSNPGFAEEIRQARGNPQANTEIEQLKQSQEESIQQDILFEASRLYSWLIEPVEADLRTSKVKTLVFVLDGSLRSIPMALLYDQKEEKYLIEKDYNIVSSYGLQLTAPQPLQRQPIKILAAGATSNFTELSFPAIPQVDNELKAIKSFFGQSEILLNDEFTEISLEQKLQKSDFSVVHLATHGQSGSTAEQTFVLSGATQGDRIIDSRQFANLLQNANRQRSKPIELLIFSVDIGGSAFSNQGNYDLAEIAIKNGVRSTIAPLWSIDDNATANLMEKFYQNLAADTQIGGAEALRKAQLDLLVAEDSRYRHPFYWASFVWRGNWL